MKESQPILHASGRELSRFGNTRGSGGRIVSINKKYCRTGGMVPSEWTRSVRAIRDTTMADCSNPGRNTMRRVAYPPSITVRPFLLARSVLYFKRTLWRCG
jgi:hypothetical protein